MGVRDALLLNLTGSNFQALQTDDTARLKGDLSLQKDDGTEVLGIDVSTATLNLTGGITGSGNISSSLSSTGSFGRVVATTFHGDGSALKSTLPRSANIVTASAQLSAEISGAFTAGFEFSSSISGSATSTGSFGRLEGLEFHGDGSGIKTTLPRSTGIVTSSAQLAADISGSFNKGFNYEGIIKGATVTAGGSWSAGGAMSQAKAYGMGVGDKSAALAVGGAPAVWPATGVGNADVGRTEEYDGSSWSEAPDYVTARNFGSATGTQNDALIIGGFLPPAWYGVDTGATEIYDGTSFSEVNDLNQARRASAGAGVSTNSSLAYGGYQSSAPVNPTASPLMTKMTEEWNGTNWSEVNDLPSSIRRGMGGGTVNAAIWFGGRGSIGCTFHYNGTNWSEGGTNHRNECNVDGGGAQNDAISAGSSYNIYSNTTQVYDGSVWSSANDRINSIGDGAVGVNQGKASTAILFGGSGPTYVPYAAKTCTEEWTGGSAVVSGSFGRLDATTITGDATPIISSLPFPSGLVSGSGILASDISGSFNKGFGLTGNITTPMDAWSDGQNMNTARYYFGAKGYVDAAIAMGGITAYANPYPTTDNTELWNGTSWTEVNNLNYSRNGGYGGTVESGYFSAGGIAPWSRSEEWNGTNWSEATAFGQRNGDVGGCSPTQVYSIGSLYDGGQVFDTYNAGVCTEGPILSIGTCAPFGTRGASDRFGHAGNADCLLVFTCHFTEEYNGSSWSVLSHNAGEYSGRYTGFTDSNPNPAKLNGVCNKACTVRGNTGAGTTNDAYSYGGEVGPLGGPAWNQNCSRAMFQRWDGISWSRGVEPPTLDGGVVSAQGIGDGANAFVLGGRSWSGYPANVNTVHISGSIFLEGQSSASFGLLSFVSASGNAKSLHTQLPYSTNPSFGIISSSAQIAADICGSFNKGFEFSGQIKASSGGVFSLGTSMLEQQTGAVGGSMNKGTAFVAGGAYAAARDTCACHQQYNGTSWSEAADLNDARKQDLYGAGESNAAVVHGGNSGPATNKTEEWNGSAWSEVNTYSPTYNVGASSTAAGESSEAALRWSLYDAAEWNGTNWSEFTNQGFNPTLDGGHYNMAGTGTVNAALTMGGQTPHNYATTGYDRSLRAFRTYDGSNWTECPNMIIQQYMQNAFGSVNDAVSTGGFYFRRAHDRAPAPFGGFAQSPSITGVPGACVTQYSQYWDGSTWSIAGRLLTRVRGCCSGGSAYGGASGGGASNQGFIAGGGTPGSPYNTDVVQLFDPVTVSGSFGRIDATTFHGDGSGLTNVLPSGLVTASAQLAADISGSFNKGFGFSGEISGSETGSFGRIEADFLHGDGSSIKDSLSRSTGIVSGAAQLAADISGSFTSGFEYEGLIQTAPGGVWSDSGAAAFPGGRTDRGAVIGIQKAFLQVGREPGATTEAYEFNGSNWSSINDFNNGRKRSGGIGTVNEAVLFGGGIGSGPYKSNFTETFNGTNWSEVNDMILSQDHLAGAGSSYDAALAFGGIDWPSTIGKTEEWNGTNWTAVNDMINAGIKGGGTGESSEAAIAAGSPSRDTYTETWNGTNWSAAAAMSLGRCYNILSGTTNDAIVYGGTSTVSHPVQSLVTETWNGSSWSTGPNHSVARNDAGTGTGGNVGASQGAAMIGSYASTATEFYDGNVSSASFHNIEITNLTGDGSQFSASLQSQLLTSVTQISNSISGSFNKGFDLQGGVSASFGLYSGAWTTGASLINTNKRHHQAVGNKDNSIHYGGWGGSRLATTELWNGATGTWTELNDMANARNTAGDFGSGVDGAIGAGGAGSAGSAISNTEAWNGINWSEATELPSAKAHFYGAGSSVNAGLAWNGAPGASFKNLEWNGSAWSEIPSSPNTGIRGAGTGQSSEAAIQVGGPSSQQDHDQWNGTAWTEEASLSVGRKYQGVSGNTNDAIVAFGTVSTNTGASIDGISSCTELWNGLSWNVGTATPTACNYIEGTTDASTRGSAQFVGYGINALWSECLGSGSFGQLRGTVGGEIKTNMFNITGSTFKLPLFSDQDLNYISQEPEESTGSISGSVARVGDVSVLDKPGNFFFHSDYNALGFTYVSSSVYSQSIDFVSCGYHTGSSYITSSGFITQSHYCYKNVIQYITGSYT